MGPALLPRFLLPTTWVLILALLTHPGLLISKLLNLANLPCCWHYYLTWSTLSIIQDLDASLALSFLSYLSSSWRLYRVCLLFWRLYRVCFLCLAVLPRPTAPGGSTRPIFYFLCLAVLLRPVAPGGSTPTNCTWRFFPTSSSFCAWQFCPDQLHLAVLSLPALILVTEGSHPTSSSFFAPSGSTSPSVLLAVLSEQLFANLVRQTYLDQLGYLLWAWQFYLNQLFYFWRLAALPSPALFIAWSFKFSGSFTISNPF